MAAGSIVIDLLMKTGSFETDTKRAEKALKQMEKTAVDAGKQIAAGLAVVGTATATFIKLQIDAADEMGKAAAKAGVTTESLSALAYAAELSGSTQEEMTQALGKLSRQMSEAAAGGQAAKDAFAAIGVSVTDSSGRLKTADQVFKEISDRFSAMPDGVQKTNAAIELFGRSGANLIPTLNSGAAGLKQMADEAARLGIIIDSETAAASAEFNDNLSRLKSTFDGLVLGIAKDLLPWLIRMTDEFLVGIKHTNGLIDAIVTLGTINPFRDQSANLKAYREELAGLEADRARYLKANADTTAIDQAIANVQKKINYLAEMERRAQAAGVTYSPDNQSSAEARRLGLTGPAMTSLPAPATVKTGKGTADTASGLYVDVPADVAELERRAQVAKRKAMLDGERQTLKEYENEMEAHDDWMKQMREGELRHYEGMLDKRFQEEQDAINKTKDLTKELGLTFTSAFEDAIVEGKKLSEVLKGLAQDILRIATRKLVTEPFAESISSFAKTFDFSKILNFAGFRANGGPVSSGKTYLVGERGPELFTPSTSGSIVSNENMGGGGVSVNIINNSGAQATAQESVDSRGRRRIDVVVGELTAGEMRRTGSAVNSAMRQSFNVAPALVGR